MRILVTSASGANGDGYGKLLAFSVDGIALGAFCEDRRIVDPRGLQVSDDGRLLYVNSGGDRILALNRSGTVVLDSGYVPMLNPGGGNLGPDGRYYVGLRTQRTIAAFPPDLSDSGTAVLNPGIVPFPRGFAHDADGHLFLASGIGRKGEGENAILRLAPDGTVLSRRFVIDEAVSPLDLAIGPNGNVFVSSEFPFGSVDAVTTVREYDKFTGALVRVFAPGPDIDFRRPRGLRFGPDGHLYCAAQDEVVAFDCGSGRCLGAIIRFPRLNGQAIAFFGR